MSAVNVGAPIRWRLHLPATPEEVFEALATDAGRAAFWAESAVEREGAIDFQFIDGSKHRARIRDLRPPSLFAIEYFGGEARFELSGDERGGTDLTLTHTGVTRDEWIATHAGWLNVLFPLKAWLMAGIDLRNHDPARTWDKGYVDQ